MVKRREFQIPSSDGISKLHVVLWEPDGPVKGVFQIAHGMIDHIMRYEPFAVFLAENGYKVIGHDHLGHGKTARAGRLGYFADKDGHICLIKDMHRVFAWMKHKNPELPYYMMGHSMGSYFLRRYLTLYGRELSGAVLMGIGDQSLLVATVGKLLSTILGAVKGKLFRSRLMHQLVIGKFCCFFYPVKTENDWLSRDEEAVKRYCQDRYCNFYFTCGAYQDFFNIMLDLKLGRQVQQLPYQLPILIMSGTKDPVGEFGKGAKRIYERYKKAGIQDVQLFLYPDHRHELLNETDKTEIYQDILNWLLGHKAL